MAKDKVGADGTEQVTEEEVTKPITPRQLKDLLKVRDEARDDAAEARAKVNEAIENLRIQKHVHVNKRALRIIEQLRELTTEKLADEIDTLLYYLDASGLTDRAKKAQRLPLDDAASRQPPPDGKVTPIRGHAQAAE